METTAKATNLERCPVCRYSLQGLPAVYRCPECGLAYDRDIVVLGGQRTGPEKILLSLTVLFGLLEVIRVARALSENLPRNLEFWTSLVTSIFLGVGFVILLRLKTYPPLIVVNQDGVLLRFLKRAPRIIYWDDIQDVTMMTGGARGCKCMLHSKSGLVSLRWYLSTTDDARKIYESVKARLSDRQIATRN